MEGFSFDNILFEEVLAFFSVAFLSDCFLARCVSPLVNILGIFSIGLTFGNLILRAFVAKIGGVEFMLGLIGSGMCANDFLLSLILIADEVQSGFGRTGEFFAFQKHKITPDIISIAKGMGNGFPVGGILIYSEIKASFGLLGTTFGGNHLACAATLSVLEVLDQQQLMNNATDISEYFMEQAKKLPKLKAIKGRGLMLGLEFDFPISELRKTLIFKHHIFTGSSKNPNLIRILPPLTVKKSHIDMLIEALHSELK